MHLKFFRACSLRLLSYLLIMQPTVVFCQRQFFRDFMVPETWRNYCPGPEDAIRTLYAESRMKCALQCHRSHHCIDFSYYATTGLCNFYSFVPQEIYYHKGCTFLMDCDALSGCPTKERMEGSCTGANDEFYGCLTLTKVNGTLTDCLAPSGLGAQMEAVGIDLGNGPIPLPSVNNWIVIMQRFDGSLDFYRNWIDYRNGFGDVEQGEFWLGNEKVHLLTNRTGLVYALRIEVQLYTTGRWFYADYATFSLDSENNKYAIRLSGFSGNAGDSLTNTSVASYWFHGGMSFSSWDNDNDRSPSTNCALKYGAGWWFNSCWISCLTCPYGSHFAWESLKHLEPKGRLRAARMMVKSI